MDISFFNDYVVLVVLGICLCVGYILKHVVPSKKINKFIPLLVGVLGVLLNTWLNDWAFTPEILLGGLASGLASTGLHQAFTNLINKETFSNLFNKE